MCAWKPPIIGQPQHVAFYVYLEKEMPILQGLNPNIENARLLAKLIDKWESLEPIQREEYELRADAMLKSYKVLMEQSLANIRRDINRLKEREEQEKLAPIIELKEQVQDKTHFQKSKTKNRQSEGSVKNRRESSLDLNVRGSVLKPSDFINAMVGCRVKEEANIVKTEVREKKSKANIQPIKIEEKSEEYGRPRNKSSINNGRQQQHPRRSQRIRSK